jgi:hypothetical protein
LNQHSAGPFAKVPFPYKDLLDLRGDGWVVLYNSADHQIPNGPQGPRSDHLSFVVKSTKTIDDFEARRFAQDLGGGLF